MALSVIPVILCGGAGSRLWPISREQHPKPFIRLNDTESLLQKAFLRGAALHGVNEIVTVTNRELFFKSEDEFQQVNERKLPIRYLLEPFGRNTAAAIAAAALHVQEQHGDQTTLLVLPADHLIEQPAAFSQAVTRAVELAGQGKLVAFGITPTGPETGYGYIEADHDTVIRFVEKPDLASAQHYLESGRFLWNSGMFCFQASTLLANLNQHSPAVLHAVQACLAHSRSVEGAGQFQLQIDPDTFAAVPDISIDYAVMEKSADIAVVPCDIGWSDVGSWEAVAALTPADAQGNNVQGQAVLHNVQNCYIHSPDRMVGATGINNLVIIDTPDALLVANRNATQDVKHLYTQLKANGHPAYHVHRSEYRPWGSYTVLEEGNRFKIKRLEVKPGGRLSLQMHHHRSEHWVVVSGMAKVINGDEEKLVNTNESTYIPAGHRHRLENPGVIDLILIEVQSGEYLGEDDIVRFDDHYGRS